MKKKLLIPMTAILLGFSTAPVMAQSAQSAHASVDEMSWGSLYSFMALLLPAVQKIREAAR